MVGAYGLLVSFFGLVFEQFLCLSPFCQPFQPGPAPLTASLAGWMANPSSVPHQAASVGPMGMAPPNNAGNFDKTC